MSKLATIPAVQGFKLDEIQSQQGPVVALTVTLPAGPRGEKTEDIDIGFPLHMAEALGKNLVDLTEKMKTPTH